MRTPNIYAFGDGRKTLGAGFTLVEILIVVVILGLLATLAMPAYSKIAQVTHRNMMLADAKQVGSAVEQYFTEEGVRIVILNVDTETGNMDFPIGRWVPRVTKGTSITSPVEQDGEFVMAHPKVRGGQDGSGALGEGVRFTSFGQLITVP